KAPTPQPSKAKDKGKAIMVEPEKTLKKKDQIAHDEQVARELEAQMKAELEEDERISREKDEAKIVVIAQWDDVQSTIDADKQSPSQSLKLPRAKDKGKKIMVEPKKPLKRKDQIAHDEEVTIELEAQMQAELEEDKRLAREKNKADIVLEQESDKKQKLDEKAEEEVNSDQEQAEMRMYMRIVPDDEIAIDAIALATKPPIIVDWKIIKEEKISYFQIIRADGCSRRYSLMIQMLQHIDREDLETI
nr:hypothetical protein [Tanacetum cinerariifolium]